MTKLVDVQGLKPCPARGSGSSPDTGIITTLSSALVFKLFLIYIFPVDWVWLLSNANSSYLIWVFTNSWLIHCLFIFISLVALLFKPIKMFYLMFLLNNSIVWSVSVFGPTIYIILVLSFLLYSLPLLSTTSNFATNSNNTTTFSFVSGPYLANLVFFILLMLLFNTTSWSSAELTAWFGHIIFSSFQLKSQFVIFFSFACVLYLLCSVAYFSSREIYDFIITITNMYYWISLLFACNSIITMIFIIEVQSALLFLLLVTSSFSSSFYYRNSDLSDYNFFSNSIPASFIQSIMYFFWISLIGSLNLFLFTIFLYQKLFSFDWFLLEHIFYYTVTSSSYKEAFTIGLAWSIFLFSLLTKCGIAPFFIWKPTFFKGIGLHTIIFYICFFYYCLFIFFIHLLTSYFHYLTYYYTYILLLLVISGIIILMTILCETFYIKSFLAVSSILNSLLVLLAVSSVSNSDLLFFL